MDTLFFNLPVQLSPALETKQANARYHNSVQALGLPGPKGLRPRYAPIPRPQAAVPLERVKAFDRGNVKGAEHLIVALPFIGPLDLRNESVRRFDDGDKFNGRKLTGKVEGATYFTSKTARALRLGEVAREMAGAVDPTQIGIGTKQNRVVYARKVEG